MHYSAHKYDTPQSKTENDFQIKNECKKEKKNAAFIIFDILSGHKKIA